MSDYVRLPVTPGNKQLKPFGYAPGGYMSKCFSCNRAYPDMDKRASSCRGCAEQRYGHFISECAEVS